MKHSTARDSRPGDGEPPGFTIHEVSNLAGQLIGLVHLEEVDTLEQLVLLTGKPEALLMDALYELVDIQLFEECVVTKGRDKGKRFWRVAAGWNFEVRE